MQNFLMAFALIFTLTCTVGCKKDGCTNQYAENYDSDADNDDGSCTLERDKFLSTYSSLEICSGIPADGYDFIIAESSEGDNKVIVSNLFNEGGSIIATIDGANISFENELNTTSSARFDGNGSVVDTQITLSFDVTLGNETVICSLTGTKK